MNLFGRTLDGQEIASLIALSLVLVVWIVAWNRDRRESNWFRNWNAERKARRDAEIAAESAGTPPTEEPREPRGPWG